MSFFVSEVLRVRGFVRVLELVYVRRRYGLYSRFR